MQNQTWQQIQRQLLRLAKLASVSEALRLQVSINLFKQELTALDGKCGEMKMFLKNV